MQIRHIETGQEHNISSEFLIGRSSRCDLVISDKLVSGQHAQLRWTGRAWQLRDLASRNGSYIDGARIIEPQDVVVGMKLAFGEPRATHEVIDATPPAPRAIDRDRGLSRQTGRFLSLPTADNWQYMVFQDNEGQWNVEAADGARFPVRDGEQLTTGQNCWTLELPRFVERTERAVGPRFVRTHAHMHFMVGADGQSIDIELSQAGEREFWPSRVHHHLLLRLAAERLRDQHNGESPERQGWMFVDILQEYFEGLGRPRPSCNVLNQYVSRAREQCLAAGLFDAFDVIQRVKGVGAHGGVVDERQSSVGKIRLGIRHVEITGVCYAKLDFDPYSAR